MFWFHGAPSILRQAIIDLLLAASSFHGIKISTSTYRKVWYGNILKPRLFLFHCYINLDTAVKVVRAFGNRPGELHRGPETPPGPSKDKFPPGLSAPAWMDRFVATDPWPWPIPSPPKPRPSASCPADPVSKVETTKKLLPLRDSFSFFSFPLHLSF